MGYKYNSFCELYEMFVFSGMRIAKRKMGTKKQHKLRVLSDYVEQLKACTCQLDTVLTRFFVFLVLIGRCGLAPHVGRHALTAS